RVVAGIERRNRSAFVRNQVADAQRVINAAAQANRSLAVLPRIPGQSEAWRDVVLINRRRLGAVRQDWADQGGLLQVVVEWVRINLVAQAKIERQVAERAPAIFAVKRSARVAVRVVRRAGD